MNYNFYQNHATLRKHDIRILYLESLVGRLRVQISDLTTIINNLQVIYEGEGDPNVAALVPNTPLKPALYFDTLPGGANWRWNTTAQNWY